MSLMICPECGREVSDRAAACVHCGCPLDKKQALYAVVLRAVDANDPKMTERIQSAADLPEEKAAEVPHRLPFTLKRGLTYDESHALVHTFSANTYLDIIHDEDADTPGNAIPIAQNVPQTTKPVTFFTIVGGSLAALVLWNMFLLLLSIFFR